MKQTVSIRPEGLLQLTAARAKSFIVRHAFAIGALAATTTIAGVCADSPAVITVSSLLAMAAFYVSERKGGEK